MNHLFLQQNPSTKRKKTCCDTFWCTKTGGGVHWPNPPPSLPPQNPPPPPTRSKEALGPTHNSYYNTKSHPLPNHRTGTAHPTQPRPSHSATHHPPHGMAPMPREGMETQYAHHGHKEGRGYMIRLPQGAQELTGGRLLCPPPPPASEHLRAQKPPLLGSGSPPPVLDAQLDAPGQRQGQSPPSVWTRHRAPFCILAPFFAPPPLDRAPSPPQKGGGRGGRIACQGQKGPHPL